MEPTQDASRLHAIIEFQSRLAGARLAEGDEMVYAAATGGAAGHLGLRLPAPPASRG